LRVVDSESGTVRREGSDTFAGLDDVVRYMKRGRDVIVTAGTRGYGYAHLLSAAVACVEPDQAGVQSLLILPDSEDVQQVESLDPEPESGQNVESIRIVHLGPADDARTEAKAVSTSPDVVVSTTQRLIDHIRRENIDLAGVSVCILAPPEGDAIGRYSADLQYIYAKFARQPTTVLFRQTEDAELGEIGELMRRPASVSPDEPPPAGEPGHSLEQEQYAMAKRDLPFDPESMAQQIRDIVRRIHENEDPAEMNQYKRFIKKHVSIFSRAYFTAYLLKQLSAESGPTSNRASIFVSAGRNRRVHARDLVTLFTSADGITRDDIGQIKVLDNYSFVEVEATKAKQAIDSLNGSEFRGKKLTVNYARRK